MLEKEELPVIHITDPEILKMIPEGPVGPDPEEARILLNIPKIILKLRSQVKDLTERVTVAERRLSVLENRGN